MSDVSFEDKENIDLNNTNEAQYLHFSSYSPDGRMKVIMYFILKDGKLTRDDEVWEAQDMPSNDEDIESDI